MNRDFFKISLISLFLVLCAAPGFGHHSTAMYDKSKTKTIKGTVKTFQWTNPHVILWVTADPNGGESAQLWSIELTSPGNLTRAGWTKRSLGPGDQVTVEMNQLRTGLNGGVVQKVTLANGQVLAQPVL